MKKKLLLLICCQVGYSAHCNPFSRSDNHLTTLMPSPANGTHIYTWDAVNQQYGISSYDNTLGG